MAYSKQGKFQGKGKSAKERREELVNKICDALASGVAPWRKCWQSLGALRNAVTGRHYHGANILRLLCFIDDFQLGADPRFCTFNQAKEKGWRIKQGSHGARIEFWLSFLRPVLRV